ACPLRLVSFFACVPRGTLGLRSCPTRRSSDLLTLCPTLRFDIADLSATLTKALTAIDHHRCVFIMPFAITSSTGSDIQRIAQEIFNHAELLDMPITALWHTAEIADGEPFAAIERDLSEISEELREIEEMPIDWKNGHIDQVV